MSLVNLQTKEILRKVLNTNEDALKVDLDNTTISAGELNVALDSTNDSVECVQDTAADLHATVTQAGAISIADDGVIATMQDDIAALKADIAAIKAVTDQLNFGQGSGAGTALEVITYTS